MPLTDNFDGSFGSGVTLTVVTSGGVTTVPIHGIENLVPPVRQVKKDTYTPISGTHSGYEQGVLCSKNVATLEATLTYEKAHQIAMDGICGQNGCSISLVIPDGYTFSGTGGIEKIGMSRMEDSRHMTSDIIIHFNADFTATDGGDNVYVQQYAEALTAGTGSVDFTACGSSGAVDLTDYDVISISFVAPATNSGDFTIEAGASNGAALPSTVVVAPGGSEVLQIPAAEMSIDATHKILDLSGTGTDVIKISITASPTA